MKVVIRKEDDDTIVYDNAKEVFIENDSDGLDVTLCHCTSCGELTSESVRVVNPAEYEVVKRERS